MNRRGILGLFLSAPALTLDKPLPSGAVPSLTVNRGSMAAVSDLIAHCADFPNAAEISTRVGNSLRVRLPDDYGLSE